MLDTSKKPTTDHKAQMQRELEAVKEQGENVISALLHMADTSEAFREWQQSPEGIAAAEKAEQMSREEMNAQIISLLEQLGLIPPEKDGDSQ